MENAASKGDCRKLFQLVKETKREKGTATCLDLNDKNGNKITNAEDRIERWVEHFEVLLNREPPPNPPIVSPEAPSVLEGPPSK